MHAIALDFIAAAAGHHAQGVRDRWVPGGTTATPTLPTSRVPSTHSLGSLPAQSSIFQPVL